MKTFLFALFFCQLSFCQDVWVNTSTGGYWRTAPNSTNRDNFSTLGNVNKYTGKPGTITPDNNQVNYNSAVESLNALKQETSYNLPSSNEDYSYLRPEINITDIVKNQYKVPSEITNETSNSQQDIRYKFTQPLPSQTQDLEVNFGEVNNTFVNERLKTAETTNNKDYTSVQNTTPLNKSSENFIVPLLTIIIILLVLLIFTLRKT